VNLKDMLKVCRKQKESHRAWQAAKTNSEFKGEIGMRRLTGKKIKIAKSEKRKPKRGSNAAQLGKQLRVERLIKCKAAQNTVRIATLQLTSIAYENPRAPQR